MCFIIVASDFLLKVEIAQCFHLPIILPADDTVDAALAHISRV